MFRVACAAPRLEPGLPAAAALRLVLLASASASFSDPWDDPILNYSFSATMAYSKFERLPPEESAFAGNDSLQTDWAEGAFSPTNQSGPSNGSGTTDLEEPFGGALVTGITSVILGLMILVTVIGNVFVIAAILLERNLQSVANYLIVSLAVADLMVACLVMPLGAVYAISQGWILGPELCDMWTSSDVLCCTASILHLVAIAVDRFWAVTNVDYIHTRNSNRICGMIAVVWTVALVVSLAPQFGWKDPDYLDRINVQQRCLVSQDVAYQIFATCSTFYVPLLVILVLYWKIFQTARKRIRRRTNKPTAPKRLSAPSARKKAAAVAAVAVAAAEATSTSTIGSTAAAAALRRESGAGPSEEGRSEGEEGRPEEEESTACCDRDSAAHETTAFTITASTTAMTGIENHAVATTEPHADEDAERASVAPRRSSSRRSDGRVATPTAPGGPPAIRDKGERREKKESLEAKRERKAAKTLAIITGAFVACWLPFFIMALLMPLCESCTINEHVSTFFLWLGYFNSTLNPVIYTIFSPEFRNAFKRILCGRASARSSYRPRKLR